MTKKDIVLTDVRFDVEESVERIFYIYKEFYQDRLSPDEYTKEVISTLKDYFECALNDE